MNDLSTEVKYGVVIFYDKSQKFVTERQYRQILIEYTDPEVGKLHIGDAVYAKPSISKVLTMEEFYDEYSEERIKIDPLPPSYQPVDNKIDYRKVHEENVETARKMSDGQLKKKIKQFEVYVKENQSNITYRLRDMLACMNQERTQRTKK